MAQTSSQDASLRRPLSQFQQAMLSFYWFATNVQWSAVLIVLMPSQIKLAVGDATKGSTLGIALAIGAFMSMVIAPAFGALSDRVRLPGGRRKPWVVLGTIGNNIGLLGLAFFILPGQMVSLPLWIGAFLVVELFNNLATAPYSALIPDVVPMSQRGSASGWMGLMTVLGMFVGGLLGFLLNALGGITGVYMMLIGIMSLGALATYFGVKEPENLVVRKMTWKEFLRGLYSPFQSANFTWVFLTRLLVSMGIYTIQEFLQYYMGDVIGAPYILAGVGKVADAAEQAASFFLLPLLLGAIISTLVAGILSDRFGRKLMVYLTGVDPYQDQQCLDCVVLPICGGGCARRRLLVKYHGLKGIEYCSPYKTRLRDYLEAYIETVWTREMFSNLLQPETATRNPHGYRIISPAALQQPDPAHISDHQSRVNRQ